MRMNKKKIIGLSAILLLIVAVVIIVVFAVQSNNELYDVNSSEALESYQLLESSLDETKSRNTYYDYIDEATITYGDGSYSSNMLKEDITLDYSYTGKNTKVLEYKDTAEYEVSVDKEGYYYLCLDTYILDNPLTDYNLSIRINDEVQFDEAERINVPISWKDETKTFPLDSYGDETLPLSIKIKKWKSLDIYDNKYSTDTPLLFYFKKGVNKVSIKLITSNGRLVVGDLLVNQPKKIVSYGEYIMGMNQPITEKKSYSINAISYSEKNSSYVRMGALDSSLAQPFDNSKKRLNIIDGSSWNDAGQEISYEIEVEKAGLYSLDIYYRNNKNEFSVFRSFYIDGNIPFAECLSYELPATGSKYELHTLCDSDGKDYLFYLSKGTHTITIKAEVAPLYKSLTELQLVIDHINQLALEVLKITGSDVDENRTWDITKYIPETESYLNAYNILLKNIVNELSVYSKKGVNSSSIAFVNRAIKLLEDIIEKPEELPLYLDKLYSGTSSVNQLLGDVLNNISLQPIYLESFYLNANAAKSSIKTTNIFKDFWNGTTKLFQTFFSEKYQTKEEENVVNVWVNRPITYIDTMQKMIDADYNQTHDIKIKLSAMPDQSKLTLSVAAGNAPDVVLGVQSYIPYDLAIRGGVYDLTNFEDFYEVCERFVPGSLLSFVVSDEDGDKIYAIPESLDFNVVAYREDIFSALNISTDLNTWNDLVAILPTLQRYGMNFYLPIAADNSTKWFYQTSNMLLQCGGSLYAEDGLSVAINEKAAVEGLEILTTLFTEKSLPTSVPSFYSQFRNGTLPIGVMNFATYLQMKNAAPEIAGKWKILQPFGTERVDENGNSYVNRTYITSGTSCSIMQDSKYKNESWEFLKWWTSKEIQTQFGYNLQSTYGPEYLWLSSNLEAVEDCQLEQEAKEVILESLKWIVDVQRNPGQYMVERGLSNIWTATVLNGEPLRVEIQNEVITMNREIRKKMEEFGYIDKNGNILKAFYTRDVEWIEQKIREESGR